VAAARGKASLAADRPEPLPGPTPGRGRRGVTSVSAEPIHGCQLMRVRGLPDKLPSLAAVGRGTAANQRRVIAPGFWVSGQTTWRPPATRCAEGIRRAGVHRIPPTRRVFLRRAPRRARSEPNPCRCVIVQGLNSSFEARVPAQGSLGPARSVHPPCIQTGQGRREGQRPHRTWLRTGRPRTHCVGSPRHRSAGRRARRPTPWTARARS
jgi:hypothetical protein